ncbi:MAG: hypothetical protein A2545_04830 [Planctomycetes bacterium RIFOXYD2_FULL_41_16]|nr:MAG: hypothetical protein A2069_03070 [Planctomycetes bacterium GWB2_41_19]OHB46547.1 MAG: hypothetical protein A2094_05240 [Planctomycetes bacterium GWE2_41_14]OHC07086.1 MAG: hypothetical protein A3J92_02515 [Planctomycetes bacterium RIFOXYC2_FULL_41_27]OHC08681.1 MAG: hypothetical protein A2545_04830 [Planctomycetes bacterium RIFOXYD2_FULL_41_16]OHC11550.1 MAG: hypothetical protein A3K50_00075 [Planctomycetes bacterium RIFOXYD12_FULL_42_12]
MKSNGGTAGVDRHSIEAYEKEAEKNLVELEKIRREGNYRAKPAKRVWIPKIGSKETISHKTRRTSGEDMKCMIGELNKSVSEAGMNTLNTATTCPIFYQPVF